MAVDTSNLVMEDFLNPPIFANIDDIDTVRGTVRYILRGVCEVHIWIVYIIDNHFLDNLHLLQLTQFLLLMKIRLKTMIRDSIGSQWIEEDGGFKNKIFKTRILWNPRILPVVYTRVGAKFNRFFIILGGVDFSTRKLWSL